ncbi:MAG: molybdopterin converting factor subunit 1 [Acidobacteriota bacterium]
MKVRLLFFAVLRDITGQIESDLTVADGTRAADVWEILRQRYTQLAGYTQPPMIAINEEYARADSLLREGDQLAFIPPVAGG